MRRFENILFATQSLPDYSDVLGQAVLLTANNPVPVKGQIAYPVRFHRSIPYLGKEACRY
jgi:hypothetical protein